MKRITVIATVVGTVLSIVGLTGPAQAKAPGPNGQITFTRNDPTCGRDCQSTFTVNPDGSHLQELLTNTCCSNWSPNGTELSFLSDCSFGGPCAATIVNADTRAVRTLPNPDPAVYNEFFSCNRWSPDGTKLNCDVSSDTPGFTGTYTISSADGGDLTPILYCATECGAADWSPDGTRIDLGMPDPRTGQQALWVVNLDGTGLKQITPSGMDLDLEDGVANWSPNGNQIVFGGRTDADHRRSIFVVNPDGTGLHQVPIPGCGGAFSDPTSIACWDPSWSPDGTKIVFGRSTPKLGTEAIYTANADGSGLSRVTPPTNHRVSAPDWGSDSLAQ